VARPRKFTTQSILEAARQCFLEHGPSVSTELIAAKLGTSQATLFKRFGTKQQLMLAALRPQATELIESIEIGPGPGDIEEQLIERGCAMITFFRKAIPCWAVLSNSSFKAAEAFAGNPDAPPMRARRAWSEWFEVAQTQGRMRAFPTEPMAIAFIGMLQARPVREFLVGDTHLTCSDEAYVRDIVGVVFRGMRPEKETSEKETSEGLQ